MLFLYVAPDGQVRATDKKCDLKTPFKWLGGYEGQAFELSATPVDLTEYKPKAKAGTPAAAANSVDAALRASMEENAKLQRMVEQLLARAVATDPNPKPAAPPQ